MEKFIHDEYTLTAMKLVREGKSFFITGKAGTGKTRLLGEIVRESRARGKNIVVASPTGVAAKNAEGQTLHSLFGLKTITYILSDKQKKAKVGNMLTKMREEGDIENTTAGNVSIWSLLKSKK